MQQQIVMLNLTVPEIELVLRALGAQPLAQVVQVYGKIQAQAQEQLREADPPPAAAPPTPAGTNGATPPAVVGKRRMKKAAPPVP